MVSTESLPARQRRPSAGDGGCFIDRRELVVQIDIKGRNVPVTDALRTHLERRLTKVSRQVSDLARLEIEIFKEPNPRVADCQVAECTLYLKGVTLRAHDASRVGRLHATGREWIEDF